MPDSVHHKVNNTPNQVSCKAPDDWLVVALKSAIKARGVSMRDLSDRLSIPYRSLQNYLSGESRIPADVLLRVCAEIGLEADHLLKGSFEVAHGDLYDAVLRVFKDVLPSIEIGAGNRLRLREEPSKDHSEALTVAHILAVRLNEAYAHFREASFKGGVNKPQSSSEVRKRSRQANAERQAGASSKE